jgi:uncharacterized membrane protein YqiK
MSEQPDWMIWIWGAAVVALFLFFFLWVGQTLFGSARQLVATIQNWPQTRRAMVEAEARSGGRYPLWYRAVRVGLVMTMIGLVGLLLWRRFF